MLIFINPTPSTHTFTAPEGFDITVHSNTDLVPEKIIIHTLLIQFSQKPKRFIYMNAGFIIANF